MVDTILFEYRIQCTQKYLSFLEDSLALNWEKQYFLYQSKQLSLPYAFVLVHPWHCELLTSQDIKTIYGARTFQKEVGLTGMQCLSETIWGYKCSHSRQSKSIVQADHLFPYSLGGPTISSNKIYLCKFHNQMKSNDIHFYPWERGEPAWLATHLQEIAKRKGLS